MKNNSIIRENSTLKRIFGKRETTIAIPLVLIIIIVSFVNPVFVSFDNIVNVLRQTSFVFIVGIGMTFILISAGLDLSVGSVLALGGVIAGLAVKTNMAIPLAILLGVLSGAAVGLFNGIFITKYKIPSLIVTLGMMYFARGIVQVLTRGEPVYPLPDSFNYIGQGEILGFPIVVYIALVLAIIAHITLTKTGFGRSVYAIGGNQETARLSGINITRVSIWVYVLTGIAAALTGILTAARVASAQSNAGIGMELQVVASCIIGGTSMFGGVGTILGTLIGTAFMSVVANGMVLLKISVYYQSMVIGAIIILAVGIDQYSRKKNGMIP
jgi:ribose/xylose/arabinose/galactoside ABC-type transport system permease subunit